MLRPGGDNDGVGVVLPFLVEGASAAQPFSHGRGHRERLVRIMGRNISATRLLGRTPGVQVRLLKPNVLI